MDDAAVRGDAVVRSTVAGAHRASLLVTDTDLVEALTDKLGSRLVAFMASRDTSTLSRWRRPGARLPDDSARALRLVYEVFRLLEAEESDHTIRAWFIGMNPQLDDTSPAEAVHDGQLKEVLVAARAFAAGG